MASIHLEAAPLGAAVSWIPYDNRNDFIIDRRLLNTIIEDGDQSFFKITPHHHSKIETHWPFKSDTSSSFMGVIQTRVSELINEFKSSNDPDIDPFLVIAISSHGGEGVLGVQGRNPINLDQMSQEILKEAQRFFKETGHSLRLEILYAACFSGSLIRAIDENKIHFKDSLGPISVLTGTSDDKKEYVSQYRGDHLLHQILQLKEASKDIVLTKKWKNATPTLAQFGFYKHVGAGQLNHPQFYGDHFDWSEEDTVTLFNQPIGQKLLTSKDLLSVARSVPEAIGILTLEDRNSEILSTQKSVTEHLHSPNPIIRYATALKMLELAEPAQIYEAVDPFYTYFVSDAQSVILEWLQDPQFDEHMAVLDRPEEFYSEYLRLIPATYASAEVVISFLEKLYKQYGRDVSSLVTAKFREVLKARYRAGHVNTGYREDIENNRNAIKKIPPEVSMAYLKIYYGLNSSNSSIHDLAYGTQAEENKFYLRKPLPICKHVLENLTQLEEQLSFLMQRALNNASNVGYFTHYLGGF